MALPESPHFDSLLQEFPTTEMHLQKFTLLDRIFTSVSGQPGFLQAGTYGETEKSARSVNMPQDWEGAYRAAVLETDRPRVIGQIDSAISMLRACLLNLSSSPTDGAEMGRIADALRTLDLLRRIELRSRRDRSEANSTAARCLRGRSGGSKCGS